MKKRLYLVPVCLLVVLSLLLGACTKATPTTSTTTQPVTTTKPATTTPATTAKTTVSPTINKTGGSLKFLWNDTSPLMGYPVTNSMPGGFYGGFSVETLVETTTQPYVYAPLLAISWDLAPDRTSYTFHLRKGVKFHDGTDLNAAAVKWNIDNVIAAKRTEVSTVSSVDVIDDSTVRVNLKTWTSLVLDSFSQGILGIVSPTAYQKNGQDWSQNNPTGTGAFKYQEYSQSQYVKYVKNPNYWDPKLPYLDTLEVDAIKDPMTRLAMLLAGDVNGSRELDVTSAQTIIASGKYNLELGAMGNFLFYFNSTDPTSAWSNPQMRMALEYALDKQTMSDVIGKGFTHPSYEIITGIWEVQGNNPGTTPRKYDPVKAAQLIKDAGYTSGIKTTLDLNSKFATDFINAAQSQLGKVGITIDINPIPQAAWQEKLLVPTAPNVLRFERGRGGPFSMLRTVQSDLATTALIYPGNKRPDGWDTMLNQALQETDAAKIMATLNQMEQKAYGEAMQVPLYIEQSLDVWSTMVKNDRGPICVWGGQNAPGMFRYVYFVK